MTRRIIFGIFLAAAVAMPAGFPNPFKKSKPAPPTREAAKTEAKPKPEASKGFDSLYTKGTIAAIPALTNGKLDLSDKTALRFHYGKPTWSLDYSKVVSIEVADPQQKFFKVPKLMKDKRIFHLTFEGDNGKNQNAYLEMPVDLALEALPLLEERTGKSAVVEGMMNPDGWWGDRYWRTARNQSVWDEATAQTTKGAVAQKTNE